MRFDLLPPVAGRVKRGAISPAVWLLFFLLSAASSLSAQETRPLDKRVNFSTKNVSLQEALGALRTISGAAISFNYEEVARQPRITLHLTNETVRYVLEKILVQTSLQYIEDDNGGVILSPRRNRKDQVRGSLGFIVDGQVVDRKGFPLSNASVQVVGEKYGATTDANGLFRTVVNEGMVLRVSYLGMKTVDHAIRGRDFVRIMLDTVPIVMNDYVVTGYQNIDPSGC
ncbi:STN and carboxypeptidase regulatory-like domain-containing protein [Puia sp. P3]|uniref:STN and carboxypeptidase regulatory-like domain-containing protein n=1 Tax=Puia sp. P3 TaxID=3423952 RepID=UPI003D67E098